MAEEWPRNLDDGELWLPSDVIRAVGVYRNHQHHYRRQEPVRGGCSAAYSGDLAAIEDIVRELAAFRLLERRRVVSAVKPLQGFFPNPNVHFQRDRIAVSVLSPSSGGLNIPEGRSLTTEVAGCGGGTVRHRRTVDKFQSKSMMQTHVGGFGTERTRVLLGQREQQQSHGMYRFQPSWTSGSARENGGTGVFLPRVVHVDAKKKHSGLNGAGGQCLQSTWSPVVGSQAMHFPPAEMGLPQDWTY